MVDQNFRECSKVGRLSGETHSLAAHSTASNDSPYPSQFIRVRVLIRIIKKPKTNLVRSFDQPSVDRGQSDDKIRWGGDCLSTLAFAAKTTEIKGSLRKMLGITTSGSFTPKPKGRRLQSFSHQLDDLSGFKAKLCANRFERSAVFPCHLNDAINLSFRQICHYFFVPVQASSFCFGRAGLRLFLRQRLLQYLTSRHTLDHFFRQVIGFRQVKQIFSGKSDFFISFTFFPGPQSIRYMIGSSGRPSLQ